DFRRVYLDDIGAIEYARNAIALYTEGFLKTIDQTVIRQRKFKLVIDYSHGSSVEVLAPIFNASQVDVIALNATMDPARYSRSREEFEHDLEMLASITATLKADLGVRIDAAGEKIFVVDDRGRQLDSGKLLAAMTELTLRGSRGAEEAAH